MTTAVIYWWRDNDDADDDEFGANRKKIPKSLISKYKKFERILMIEWVGFRSYVQDFCRFFLSSSIFLFNFFYPKTRSEDRRLRWKLTKWWHERDLSRSAIRSNHSKKSSVTNELKGWRSTERKFIRTRRHTQMEQRRRFQLSFKTGGKRE